jgi:glycosyl transferase family 92
VTHDGPSRSQRGRDGSDGRANLAVCAIYRWEAEYLREWVAFHRVVGVERFFLYDNGNEDAHLEALAPYLSDGSVVLHPWPVFPGQPAAYDHCLEHHRDDARWIAFIDCDEFLFSPTGRPVPDVLRAFEGRPGVGVNRIFMGTSGHRTKPPGLVIENYVHRLEDPEPNRAVKSIVDPARVERRRNAHAFAYLEGARAVDEQGDEFDDWVAEHDSTELLRINHYMTKSEEEAAQKFARPQAGTGKLRPALTVKGLRRFNERYAVPDEVILRYLAPLREELERVRASRA